MAPGRAGLRRVLARSDLIVAARTRELAEVDDRSIPATLRLRLTAGPATLARWRWAQNDPDLIRKLLF